MKWFVVTDGVVTKVTELLSSDKGALLEPGFHIVCDKNGYDSHNDAFTSMIASSLFSIDVSEETGREVAVEMIGLP